MRVLERPVLVVLGGVVVEEEGEGVAFYIFWAGGVWKINDWLVRCNVFL